MLEDSRKHFQPNDVLTRRGGSAVVKKNLRVVIVAALLLAAVLPLHGQLPKDPEERKKVLAQIFEANARQLTLFDRDDSSFMAWMSGYN